MPSASSFIASENAVRSQRSFSSEYIQYGLRWRIRYGFEQILREMYEFNAERWVAPVS